MSSHLLTSLSFTQVLHFSRPLHSILKPIQEGYELGMAGGDFNRALECLILYLQAALVAGRPLSLLESQCRLFATQMKDFRQEILLDQTNSLLQLVEVLRYGHNENNEALLDADHSLSASGGRTAVTQAYYNTFKLQQAVWFYHYEEAVEFASRIEPITKTVPGLCLCYSDNLFRGIAYFEVARQRKRQSKKTRSSRRFRKAGRKILNTIKKWVERGNPNVQHHEALLEAEWAILQGMKTHVIRKQYDIAVIMASRLGFISDAALANERYGDFLLVEVGDREEAMYRLKEAIKLYEEWGASAKANKLLEKYEDLWEVPSRVSCGAVQ